MPGAARTGDMALTCGDPVDAPTGAVIAAGTVMINKMPAAKEGDQVAGVDIHIVLIPAIVPIPTPIPHPFAGMLDGELESSVMIMGKAAAVVGSEATNTPPHIPMGGPFQKPPADKGTIKLGSTDVIIGSGSGGGGGSGGGSVTGSDGIFERVAYDTGVNDEADQGHFIDLAFEDKGGNRVVGAKYSLTPPNVDTADGDLAGHIKQFVPEEGDCEIKLWGITSLLWSETQLVAGDEVKLQIETVGVEDGYTAKFEIFERDINKADRKIETFDDVPIEGDKAEVAWTCKSSSQDSASSPDSGGYSYPDFYYIVEVEGRRKRSAVICFTGAMEIEIVDEEGNPVADLEYKLQLSTGEIKKAKLDGDGCAKAEELPPRGMSFDLVGATGEIEKVSEEDIE